jgi:hypothetical protein
VFDARTLPGQDRPAEKLIQEAKAFGAGTNPAEDRPYSYLNISSGQAT